MRKRAFDTRSFGHKKAEPIDRNFSWLRWHIFRKGCYIETMRRTQQLLFADPRPLDKQLGREFFRKVPERPGVYLMRDAEDRVLYVGKAKNLRQRLRNYRVADPDRMPRRHLRMLRQVERIEFQFSQGESAALKHESRLLRSLRPRFNRAGVWPGKTRFLTWRVVGTCLELAEAEVPEIGWQRFGPLNGSACQSHATLSRLLWLAVHTERGFNEMPRGWMAGSFSGAVMIECGELIHEVAGILESFFWADPEKFLLWLGSRFTHRTHPFERSVIEVELEMLKEFAIKKSPSIGSGNQLGLL